MAEERSMVLKYKKTKTHPLYGPDPPSKSESVKPSPENGIFTPSTSPSPPPPPPPPSPSPLKIESIDDIGKISQNDYMVYIPSSGRRTIIGKLSAAKNSCCCESGSHLYKQTDLAWCTPNGSPVGDSTRLGSNSNIELARPDIFFSLFALEQLDARYIVVYQTSPYKEQKSKFEIQDMVRWKRSLTTCDEALEVYLNGAKQGYSILLAYAEISTQKLHEKILEDVKLADLHRIELDDGRAITCGRSAVLMQHSNETFAYPYCDHGGFHQDGALYSHFRDNEATGTSTVPSWLSFQKSFSNFVHQDAWSEVSCSIVPEIGSQIIEEDVNREDHQKTAQDPRTWSQGQLSYHVQQQDPQRKTTIDETPVSSLSASPNSPVIHSSSDQPGTLPLPENEQSSAMVLQLDSRSISQEQLTARADAIYTSLETVEWNCIQVHKPQAAAKRNPSGQNPDLAQDYWQDLIALHRTLLYEHYKFLLASQHPLADLKLRRLADRRHIPARLWKYGIHSFLEILRHRLPESLEYMLTFVSLAYQMMAVLYESFPAFEDTWIEYLGDLGRYRMKIQDEDFRDRETWAGVARFWYSKAADKNPAVGRFYHYLATLARANALKQLYFYCCSLTCVQSSTSTRESIVTIFDPTLSNGSFSKSLSVETSFIRAHAVIFKQSQGSQQYTFDRDLTEFIQQLDNRIRRVSSRWKEQGAYMAIANITSLFDYGNEDNFLRLAFATQLQSVIRKQVEKSGDLDRPCPTHLVVPPTQPTPSDLKLDFKTATTFPLACRLTFDTLHVVLKRFGDKNVLTHIHILLAFLCQLATLPYDASYIFDLVRWKEVALLLNTLARSETITPAIESIGFPHKGEEDIRPLPEDYLIRGQLWAHSYYPATWFSGVVDEEERMLELASTIRSRSERVLWLGIQLSARNVGLKYDSASHIWGAYREDL